LRRCTRRYSSQRDEFYQAKQIPRVPLLWWHRSVLPCF
jgi:hypothetical protein